MRFVRIPRNDGTLFIFKRVRRDAPPFSKSSFFLSSYQFIIFDLFIFSLTFHLIPFFTILNHVYDARGPVRDGTGSLGMKNEHF